MMLGMTWMRVGQEWTALCTDNPLPDGKGSGTLCLERTSGILGAFMVMCAVQSQGVVTAGLLKMATVNVGNLSPPTIHMIMNAPRLPGVHSNRHFTSPSQCKRGKGFIYIYSALLIITSGHPVYIYIYIYIYTVHS